MFRRAKKSTPSPVAACPSCGSVLEKRPQRKKECPACGDYIYVRTRPDDRKKVLATKDEAERIDKEWAAIHEAQRVSPEDRRVFEEARAEFRKKRGIDPSDGDVWWAVYNKRLTEYASRWDWGFYRNTRYEMAEQLVKEGRKKAGLGTFLEVWYLDANGPRNAGGMSDPNILREFPPFDPDLAIQAPAVVHSIQQLASELALKMEGLRDIYFETASRLHNAMGLPVEPARGWDDLSKVLRDRFRGLNT